MRPLVPKRLAASLRAAYYKVVAARSNVASAEAMILDRMSYLDEFHDDPARFAELYYPQVADGPDSYPVQTRISRTREELEYKTERMPVYIQRVIDAECSMFAAEQDVLATLGGMRADTSGRVDWPVEPRSLDEFRTEVLQDFKRNRNAHRRFVLQRVKKRAEQVEQRKNERAAMMQETEELMKIKLALMPPMKASVFRSVFDSLKAAMEKGEFTGADVMALADGGSDAFLPIMAAAKRRLAEEHGIPLDSRA
jgi:hypothetical protein